MSPAFFEICTDCGHQWNWGIWGDDCPWCSGYCANSPRGLLEAKKRRAAANGGTDMVQEGGAICLRDGKVALVRSNKKPHLWFFPKGHVEPVEGSPEETAIRELEEETGIVGYIVRKVGPLLFTRDGADFTVQYFLVRPVGEIKPTEVRKWFWCPINDAYHILTMPDAKMLLTAAVTGDGPDAPALPEAVPVEAPK